jgi:phosphatidyl-myo-inositol dimannoside synthase
VEICNSNRADYRRTAMKARLLIANSEYTAQKARARYPNLPNIRVCWPGKDRVQPDSMHKPVNENAAFNGIGRHAMLIVGRLSSQQRHKGHDHLIEALPLIVQNVPDAQLVIAGAGDDRERLKLKAKQLGLADSVIFTGWLDDAELDRLYSRCALFVMPSEGDGFGLVFLEAMMHSLPCVGLKHSAADEIFENEKSGILVDRENRHGMASQLSELLLDEPRRTRLGNAGFDRYQNTFQWHQFEARLHSILMDSTLCPLGSRRS